MNLYNSLFLISSSSSLISLFYSLISSIHSTNIYSISFFLSLCFSINSSCKYFNSYQSIQSFIYESCINLLFIQGVISYNWDNTSDDIKCLFLLGIFFYYHIFLSNNVAYFYYAIDVIILYNLPNSYLYFLLSGLL